MTKFSEVSHLYLGCELIGSFRLEPRKGYLTGITNGGEDVEIQFFEEDGINVFESPEFNTVKEIKPILRPISDMTEDEMKEIFNLIFKRIFPPSGNILLFDLGKKEERRVLWTGVERVGIDLSGDIWADSDLHIYKFNPHLITAYLLKQRFDLFELIKNGEAIDKTTL